MQLSVAAAQTRIPSSRTMSLGKSNCCKLQNLLKIACASVATCILKSMLYLSFLGRCPVWLYHKICRKWSSKWMPIIHRKHERECFRIHCPCQSRLLQFLKNENLQTSFNIRANGHYTHDSGSLRLVKVNICQVCWDISIFTANRLPGFVKFQRGCSWVLTTDWQMRW